MLCRFSNLLYPHFYLTMVTFNQKSIDCRENRNMFVFDDDTCDCNLEMLLFY